MLGSYWKDKHFWRQDQVYHALSLTRKISAIWLGERSAILHFNSILSSVLGYSTTGTFFSNARVIVQRAYCHKCSLVNQKCSSYWSFMLLRYFWHNRLMSHQLTYNSLVTPCRNNHSQSFPKKVFLKFHNIFRKTPVLESLFDKVAGLKGNL